MPQTVCRRPTQTDASDGTTGVRRVQRQLFRLGSTALKARVGTSSLSTLRRRSRRGGSGSRQRTTSGFWAASNNQGRAGSHSDATARASDIRRHRLRDAASSALQADNAPWTSPNASTSRAGTAAPTTRRTDPLRRGTSAPSAGDRRCDLRERHSSATARTTHGTSSALP